MFSSPLYSHIYIYMNPSTYLWEYECLFYHVLEHNYRGRFATQEICVRRQFGVSLSHAVQFTYFIDESRCYWGMQASYAIKLTAFGHDKTDTLHLTLGWI